MRMRLLLPTLTLALAALPAREASAAAPGSDYPRLFAEGVRLYKDMDFERSLEQFQLARRQPHDAAEEVQALLYCGILQFELGKEAESDQTFGIAASLDPRAALPVKVSPRVEIAYEKQRAKFAALMPELARPPAPPPEAAVAAPPAAAATDQGKAPLTPRRTAGAVLTALGAAGLLAGAISYAISADSFPLSTGAASASDRELEKNLGIGCLVGGLAVGVTGVVLLALPEGGSATAAVAPLPGGAALVLAGTLP